MRRPVRCLLALLMAVTAPSAHGADKRPFFFVQIADPQLGFSNSNRDMAPEIDHLKRAVEWINRVKPAFVLISGDMVNSARHPEQIEEFRRIAREINPEIPVHLVPGNHDVGAPTAENVASYRKNFGKDWYSFECRGSEFIVLNSSLIHRSDADAALVAEQRKWFEETLKSARKRKAPHIFVCTHHPWFLKRLGETDTYENIPAAVRGVYLGLMKQYGVDYSLAGHVHRSLKAQFGCVNLVSACALSLPFGLEPVGLRVFRVSSQHVWYDYFGLDSLPSASSLTRH